MDVFITDLAARLPGEPVGNDEIEKVLGQVGDKPSRTRRVVLRNNGIAQRYFALDPETGEPTTDNATLTADAVRGLAPLSGGDFTGVDLLCCGTSSPDIPMPGHASMVHGKLGGAPCEAVSTSGICMSGMAAMKYAYLAIAAGQAATAVATGSEVASALTRAGWCGPESPQGGESLEKEPMLAFDADFLRWMLSDGAGAAYLSCEPAPSGPSLKIEWIESVSFANELETCMYSCGIKGEDGEVAGWRGLESPQRAVERGVLPIHQDVKLLDREIIKTAVDRTLPGIIERRGLDANSIDWFLPHYSSNYFRKPLMERMAGIGFGIDESRWFTNLSTKGNTGAASIYIILEELFHSGKLEAGQRLLCFIPESGRFSMCYMLLTVV